jgi:hypothetical protein
VTTEPSAVPEATPDDVAALLTARTKDADGNELGGWTEETRPTYDEVQTRIDIARSLIQDETGAIPDQCLRGAESTVALLASMLTEAAFWPEQTQSNQSTYERLRELYLEARIGLANCIGLWTGLRAYDLDISGDTIGCWPVDWWQRNLDNLLARGDAMASRR